MAKPSRNRNSQEDSLSSGIQSDYVRFCKGIDLLPYLLAILEDCQNMNMHYGEASYLKDRETLSRRYHHEGLSFATKTLPSLFDNLLVYLETGVATYPSFKICKGKTYPVFLQQLFKPIHDDPLCETAVTCVRSLYQLCMAFKKLKGPYKQGVLAKQLSEFISTDEHLVFDPSGADSYQQLVLEKARRIVREIVQELNPYDPDQAEKFIPRPGPGATNTKIEKHERFRPHAFDSQLKEFSMEEWYNPPVHPPRGKRPWDLRVGKSKVNLPYSKRALLTSRFKFVHKTFGKARGICIEQLEMQWLQQGLRRALYDRIEKHPLSCGYVSFRNQAVNGLLALWASKDKRLATLDMSEASDRISRKLVEYLFQDNKHLQRALLTLATRTVELPQDLSSKRRWLELKKYAPMGSALCFPVMGLCHFALVKSIISMYSPQHIDDISTFVYGDDIVIPSKYADIVMRELPMFGMKMNTAKSFHKSHFRESCGVHAYKGINITPVRLKTIVQSHSSVEDLVGLIKNEGALYKRGFYTTARLIRNEFLKVPNLRAKNFPVVGPKSKILGWIREDKDASVTLASYARNRRWNEDYQRFEYKVRVIVGLYDDAPPLLDESEAYLRFLVVRPTANSSDSRTMSGCPSGSRIRWTWCTDSDLGYGVKDQPHCRVRSS